ncbi:MAG: M50 family metallopeptidase [Saprospiraceae bacterium]|nr:M50 family metallopeptidase [Saprospiraceae bacterium]
MNLEDQNILFYILLFISVIITRLPAVGKYFKVVYTLIHESAHALIALLTSAKVLRVELFSNTSGSALTQSNNKFSQFLISVAGYPLSSLSAYILFYFIHYQHYNIIIISLATLSLISLIFFVRNSYGIFWLISFIIILSAIVYFGDDFVKFGIAVFFSSIVLSESVISTFQLLIISYRNPQSAGDAFNLKKITYLPTIFWAMVFLAQSIFFLYKTLFSFFPYLNTINLNLG